MAAQSFSWYEMLSVVFDNMLIALFLFLDEVAAYELKQKEAEEKKERLYVIFQWGF